MKEDIKKQLLKGIERRIKSLTDESPLPYPLHNGHWLRDLITFRAYLINHPDLKKMIDNLPK